MTAQEMTPQIMAEKLPTGQIKTTTNGNGKEILELLIVLNRTVAHLILKSGVDPEEAGAALKAVAEQGFQEAIKDRKDGRV